MVKLSFITDGIIGGIIISIFSYLTQNIDKKDNIRNLKILSFLWAAPVLYLYIIYLLYKNKSNKKSIDAFIIHASLGALFTLIFFIISHYTSKYLDFKISIIITISFTILLFFSYFYFKLYDY